MSCFKGKACILEGLRAVALVLSFHPVPGWASLGPYMTSRQAGPPASLGKAKTICVVEPPQEVHQLQALGGRHVLQVLQEWAEVELGGSGVCGVMPVKEE